MARKPKEVTGVIKNVLPQLSNKNKVYTWDQNRWQKNSKS